MMYMNLEHLNDIKGEQDEKVNKNKVNKSS